MIPEAMFLFLLIGGDGAYEEKYIGKIPDCQEAQKIIKKVQNKYNNINGYICIDARGFEARRKFQRPPNPAEKKVIKDTRKLLPSVQPKPQPPLKKRKE